MEKCFPAASLFLYGRIWEKRERACKQRFAHEIFTARHSHLNGDTSPRQDGQTVSPIFFYFSRGKQWKEKRKIRAAAKTSLSADIWEGKRTVGLLASAGIWGPLGGELGYELGEMGERKSCKKDNLRGGGGENKAVKKLVSFWWSSGGEGGGARPGNYRRRKEETECISSGIIIVREKGGKGCAFPSPPKKWAGGKERKEGFFAVGRVQLGGKNGGGKGKDILGSVPPHMKLHVGAHTHVSLSCSTIIPCVAVSDPTTRLWGQGMRPTHPAPNRNGGGDSCGGENWCQIVQGDLFPT